MKIIRIILVVMLVAMLSFCKSTGSSNDKPNAPSNPTPADNSTNLGIAPLLQWECTDPEGDPLTYDVYLGTNPNPGAAELVAQDLTVTNFNPGTLGYVAKYYWKIVAHDDQKGSTSGPVWNFTTMGFTEDFSDGSANDFVFEDGRWYVASSNLIMEGWENDTPTTAYYNQEFKDFTVETRVGKIESNETLGYIFGLFIRSNGFLGKDSKSSDGYMISVTASGYYRVWIQEGGVVTIIIDWAESPNVGFGLYAFTKIRVDANGSNFDLYFNDIYTDSFTDATFPTGYVGLAAFDSIDGDNEIWWQYFNMSAPEAVKGTAVQHIPTHSDHSPAFSPK